MLISLTECGSTVQWEYWPAVAVALPYRSYFKETGSTGVRYSYRKLRLLTRTYLGTTLFLLHTGRNSGLQRQLPTMIKLCLLKGNLYQQPYLRTTYYQQYIARRGPHK